MRRRAGDSAGISTHRRKYSSEYTTLPARTHVTADGACVGVQVLHGMECNAFLGQPDRPARSSNRKMCPPLSRMQIIWVFIAPVPGRRKGRASRERKPLPGFVVAIFKNGPALAYVAPSQDTHGCSWPLSEALRCPCSADLREPLRPLVEPETSWIINFFSHRGTAPDAPTKFSRATSIAFPLCRGGSTWIRLYDVWRNVTLRTSGRVRLWLHLIFYKC